MPQLEKLVAVIRSREISLCLFLQAQSQLKALYKDHTETIMGNMDSIIFCEAGSKCVLQLRGLRPFFSPKYDLKKHLNYMYTAEADKRNAFDVSRLVTRPMKLDPNQEYTVYEVDAEEATDIDEDEDILNYDDVDDPEAFA